MGVHPPDHLVVHPLPAAPQFVGRGTELDRLRSYWRSTNRGLVALVGLGGAGKTAIVARFLEEVAQAETAPRPLGLLVWSFYQEPDVGYFLQEAYRYFAGSHAAVTPAKGAGLLHLLRDALECDGRHLLVLDGLERVQRQESSGSGSFGQIEDPLLKGLLSRIAEGAGSTVALVTSRFPLTDLAPLRDRGYHHIEIEGLDPSAALALLRNHGVQGDDATIGGLVESYGAHALTLDHLGGLIGQFLGGDPKRAPEAPEFTTPKQDRQALRLARLFQAYEAHLPETELALLCRLCLLERSVRAEQVMELFLCSPPVLLRTARDIVNRIAIFPAIDDPSNEYKSELAESIGDVVRQAVQERPVAGPEHLFEQSVYLGIEDQVKDRKANTGDDIEELIRLYRHDSLDLPTAERPLSWQDQEQLRGLIARYEKLGQHPLLPYKEPPEALELAFLKEGWINPSESSGDVTPADVTQAFFGVKQAIKRLAFKHGVLRRVRELCRLYQQKWEAAGPLSTLDSSGLGQVLEGLIGRHLVLREANGSLSVHPAVRDYFSQVGTASERGFWHHLIGEQLISLVQRPGLRLPTDQASLDLVEEAITHALSAGQPAKALNLYTHILGGHRHLAWKLGEMARGLRIIRKFSPCPDRWALGWYLRALGELDQAFEHNNFSFFRADIRLLQGRLAQVEKEGDPARAAIADFLMGRTNKLPSSPLGCAIPQTQLLLYLGYTRQAWRADAEPEQVYEMIGWADDKARSLLYQAQTASILGDLAASRRALESAAQWVLHSGSVEHLCLYHLVRSHLLKQAGEFQAAFIAVNEGLHVARQSGLGLYLVELLCAKSELLLNRSQPVEGEGPAREAMRLASMAECQFVWGAARAGYLVGRALIARNRLEEARSVLEAARDLQNRIGDSRVEQTQGLIQGL